MKTPSIIQGTRKQALSFLFALSVFSASAQTTILTENFEGTGMPAGWSQTTLASDGGWKFGSAPFFQSLNWHPPVHTKFANTNDDQCKCDKSADLLMTPTLNLSSYTKVYLSCAVNFCGWFETGTVEVSTNGGSTWNVVKSFGWAASQSLLEFQNYHVDLSAYAGQSNVKVGFRYNDQGNSAQGMAIDDVWIFAPASSDIKTEIIRMDTLMPFNNVYPSGNISVRGKFTNTGASTITSYTLNYKIDNGAVQSQNVSSVNIVPCVTTKFAHNIPWNATAGPHTVKAWVSNIGDANPANDTASVLVGVAASVVQKKLLIEVSTNDGCGPCASDNPVTLGVVNNNPGKLYQVSYHMSWPDPADQMYLYNTADANSRRSYYNINGIPDIAFEGSYGWYSTSGSSLQSWMNFMSSKQGFFTITGTATYNGSNIAVDYTTTSLVDFPTGNMVVQAAIVEDKTFTTAPGSNGETYFPSIMRKMFPSATGSAIGKPINGQVNNFQFNYPYNSSQINVNNCRLVVFVQDNNNKFVWQTFVIPLSPVGMEEAKGNLTSYMVYPNPTSGGTTIEFDLAKAEKVSVDVRNMLGEVVYEMKAEEFTSGQHRIDFDASGFANGMYFVNLYAGEQRITRKISVTK